MATVAQRLEHWFVVPGAVGSIPISRPSRSELLSTSTFFIAKLFPNRQAFSLGILGDGL